MNRIIDNSPIKEMVQPIIDALPDSVKVLAAGQIETILINYNTLALKVLTNLYYAMPAESNDNDWYSDELRNAMNEAKKLV